MKTIKALALIAMFFAMGPLRIHPQPQSSASKTRVPIVIKVEKKQQHISYFIDSQPEPDPLRALGRLVEQKGEDWPVIALFDWNTTLREVYDVNVLASKAGFRTVRPFVVNAGFMIEIKFGRSKRFSTDPPLDL